MAKRSSNRTKQNMKEMDNIGVDEKERTHQTVGDTEEDKNDENGSSTEEEEEEHDARYKRSQDGHIILTHCNETFEPNEYVLDDLYEGLDDADTNSKGEVRCFWIEQNGTKSKKDMWIEKRLLSPKLASHVDNGIDENSDDDDGKVRKRKHKAADNKKEEEEEGDDAEDDEWKYQGRLGTDEGGEEGDDDEEGKHQGPLGTNEEEEEEGDNDDDDDDDDDDNDDNSNDPNHTMALKTKINRKERRKCKIVLICIRGRTASTDDSTCSFSLHYEI